MKPDALLVSDPGEILVLLLKMMPIRPLFSAGAELLQAEFDGYRPFGGIPYRRLEKRYLNELESLL